MRRGKQRTVYGNTQCMRDNFIMCSGVYDNMNTKTKIGLAIVIILIVIAAAFMLFQPEEEAPNDIALPVVMVNENKR